MNPVDKILGYRKITVQAGQATRFLNLCMRLGIDPRDCKNEGETLTFFCRPRTAAGLIAAANEIGITLTAGEVQGLPRRLRALLKRPGILTGIVLTGLLCFFAGRSVWCIEVTGNVRLTEVQVIAELEDAGFGVGTRIAGLETRALENRVLLSSQDIAWISVNMSGQVAQVQIREVLPVEETPEGSAPSNLVASADGQIERFEILSGTPAVGIGQAVMKGELLVGGVSDSQTDGMRLTRASGEVFARVTHEIEVGIPLRYTEKSETGRVFSHKEIKFYKNYIKFFKNTGNCPPCCDTIKWVSSARLPGGRILPWGIRNVLWVEYEEHDAVRTPDEAMELAYAELASRIGALDGELIRKNIVTEITDEAFILRAEVTVIENIATEVPIGIDD